MTPAVLSYLLAILGADSADEAGAIWAANPEARAKAHEAVRAKVEGWWAATWRLAVEWWRS